MPLASSALGRFGAVNVSLTNVPIYGNLVQTNFLVGYDLDAGTVSFLPKDCTKA